MIMNFWVPKNMQNFFINCQQENLMEREHLEDLGMNGRIG
jgi:hypothetical protein